MLMAKYGIQVVIMMMDQKIYNSKMSLSGNTLSVSGCILIFCKAQNWTKVN